MSYAKATKVVVQKSRVDIEGMLRKAKAERIVLMDEPSEAIVMFMLAGRLIKIIVPIAPKASDQERRSRWRALHLIIKAKLEAVDQKITTVEQEFLPHTVMPDGKTVAEWVGPALQSAYDTGKMPTNPLLLEGPRS